MTHIANQEALDGSVVDWMEHVPADLSGVSIQRADKQEWIALRMDTSIGRDVVVEGIKVERNRAFLSQRNGEIERLKGAQAFASVASRCGEASTETA
jgi:hypothetical protein